MRGIGSRRGPAEPTSLPWRARSDGRTRPRSRGCAAHRRSGGAHAADEALGDAVAQDTAHLLHVVFTIEEIAVDPAASAGEQAAVLVGGCGVSHSAGHLLGGAQRAEVPDTAQRVWAVEFYV